MQFVFDMDGVLVETRRANILAYRSIGVQPPPDFHHRPWQEWVDEYKHRQKGDVLPEYLERVGFLYEAPLYLAEQLNGLILTNASKKSYETVCRLFPRLAAIPALHSMPPNDKIWWMSRQDEEGIYFDDNKAIAQRVSDEVHGWRGVHWDND